MTDHHDADHRDAPARDESADDVMPDGAPALQSFTPRHHRPPHWYPAHSRIAPPTTPSDAALSDAASGDAASGEAAPATDDAASGEAAPAADKAAPIDIDNEPVDEEYIPRHLAGPNHLYPDNSVQTPAPSPASTPEHTPTSEHTPTPEQAPAAASGIAPAGVFAPVHGRTSGSAVGQKNRDRARADHSDAAQSTAAEKKKSEKKRPWWREVLSFAGVIGLALAISVIIKTFFLQVFWIPSESMYPTLEVGDKIVVNKTAPRFGDIHRGDVVVFVDPGGWLTTNVEDEKTGITKLFYEGLTFIGIYPQDAGHHLVKRAVGVGGDHVECCDAQGRITINGTPIQESYIAPGAEPSLVEFAVDVPPDHLFVLGDNRRRSEDSRYHLGLPGGGMVPLDNVVGRVATIIWPASRIGGVTPAGSTFDNVPDADADVGANTDTDAAGVAPSGADDQG